MSTNKLHSLDVMRPRDDGVIHVHLKWGTTRGMVLLVAPVVVKIGSGRPGEWIIRYRRRTRLGETLWLNAEQERSFIARELAHQGAFPAGPGVILTFHGI